MAFIPGESPRPTEEEVKKEQQPDTVDISGSEELDKKGTTIGADTEIAPKQEREYDKLGNQLEEFKDLLADKKEEDAVRLSQEMIGQKVESAEEAKEIYKKKLELYKAATELIKENKRTKQIAGIIKQIKKEGKFEFGGKEFNTKETRRLKKEGAKINGRLILGVNGKYYFEIAGVKFSLGEAKELKTSRGRQPKVADALLVPPPLPEQPSDLPKQTEEEPPPIPEVGQAQVLSPEPAESSAIEQTEPKQSLPDDTKERAWGTTITPPIEVAPEEVVAGDAEARIDPLRSARLSPKTEQNPEQQEETVLELQSQIGEGFQLNPTDEQLNGRNKFEVELVVPKKPQQSQAIKEKKRWWQIWK